MSVLAIYDQTSKQLISIVRQGEEASDSALTAAGRVKKLVTDPVAGSTWNTTTLDFDAPVIDPDITLRGVLLTKPAVNWSNTDLANALKILLLRK